MQPTQLINHCTGHPNPTPPHPTPPYPAPPTHPNCPLAPTSQTAWNVAAWKRSSQRGEGRTPSEASAHAAVARLRPPMACIRRWLACSGAAGESAGWVKGLLAAPSRSRFDQGSGVHTGEPRCKRNARTPGTSQGGRGAATTWCIQLPPTSSSAPTTSRRSRRAAGKKGWGGLRGGGLRAGVDGGTRGGKLV